MASSDGHQGLLIVESPAKARTLAGFLGGRFRVMASVGHVRDLPQKKLGVDIANDFAPTYVVPREKQAVVREIAAAAQKAPAVLLATDPDREGEAISWHLVQAAHLEDKPVQRVVFHEITRDAVEEALRHPRDIDLNLVNAQQGRRILDRLVGYGISPLLWQKVKRGLSAGRVQSAAVKMVVDREREIQGFVPQEYWTIQARLAQTLRQAQGSTPAPRRGKGASPSAKLRTSFLASLVARWGERKLDIPDQATADGLVADLRRAHFVVAEVRQRRQRQAPAPPFTTSTLQQEAWRKLGFTTKRTMAVAQQLYEGLSLGTEGPEGLITYMRTDSVQVAQSAVAEARAFIKEKHGPEFLPASPRSFRQKAKGAQEAHEAIRSTSVNREPEALRTYLTPDQLKLYDLIWRRFVASQMADAIREITTVDIRASQTASGQDYLFRASASVVVFPGFLVVLPQGKDEENGEETAPLPPLEKDEALTLRELLPRQHFTQPPPRYTEASLVKAMEEKGIGRPSTYAPIIATVQDRGYVGKERGHFRPEELGLLVNDLLAEHFPQVVDLGFTAQLEEELDEIARGNRGWVPVVQEFYSPLAIALQEAKERVQRLPDEPTGELCELCGRPLVIKSGRFGRFVGCSGYPECRNTKPSKVGGRLPDEPTGELCELCGRPLVIRSGRLGRFVGCSGYPECKHTKPLKTGGTCPLCGGDIVEKRSKKGRPFYGCANYPDCNFILWQRPHEEPCPQCGAVMVPTSRGQMRCQRCQHTMAAAGQDERRPVLAEGKDVEGRALAGSTT